MNHVTKYTDFRGNTIDYSYDQIGNLVAITYPGGRIVRYSYYRTGQIKTVTDWDDRTTSFEYDGNGRLTKTTRPEGSVEERTYDTVGRLVTIVDKNGENVINQMVYSYDESNNVTSVSMSEETSIDGLISAEMKYNAANQLIEYNGEAVKYDADGNMIYGPLNGEMAEFEYDCRNRLISVGGISYEYDAENNRISQSENDVKTSYVVDSNSSALTRILVMTKGDDTTYFVYGTGLLAQESNDEYLIYHFNNIGSTVAVTNLDGEIAEKFEYGPYGELLSENKCGIIFLYNGEVGVATDSNGLYYMRARYYNPEIKRFINQDVVIGSITDSPTLNRYAYVNGNPISLNDPFGLSPLLNWLGGITGHDVLDVLGMIPGVGFIFDGINAVWYATEGDWFNAASSFVSALPGVGDAFGAFSKGGKACKLVTAFHKAGAAGNLILGAYTFGNIGVKYMFGDGDFTADEVLQDLFTVAMMGASMWGSAKDFGTSYCFVSGTLVTTEDGFKPIEEIEVGDRVLSKDEITGEVETKTVVKTYINETTELTHIGVNGEEFVGTLTHPFYVYQRGWTQAANLRAGDILVLSNGELVVVEWIQHEILESPVKVYNLEVEDFHTYFIGESGGWVHNKGCGEPIQPYEVTTYEDFKNRSVVGDNLEGHEMWQHANINENGLATTRLSTDVSKENIVIALPHDVHVEVNKKQYDFDPRAQTPSQNIVANANILYENPSIPNNIIDEMYEKAISHMNSSTKHRQ